MSQNQYQLLTIFDPETSNTKSSSCSIAALDVNKAALLFMSQIFQNNRKPNIIRLLTLKKMGSSISHSRTVLRSREALNVGNNRYRYVHKIIK